MRGLRGLFGLLRTYKSAQVTSQTTTWLVRAEFSLLSNAQTSCVGGASKRNAEAFGSRLQTGITPRRMQQFDQKRFMFIQTQPTPNPASLMFLPGKTVMESGACDFSSAREAMKSPLARRLFQIDGVAGVFFGSDFITITKTDMYSWAVLKPDIFAAIMDHVSSGEPLFMEGETAEHSDTAIRDDDSETVAMIKELLETRIRPAVMEDGGDIVFDGFDEDTGTVTLKMKGACSGCPSSSVTLKSGIESMLMYYVPEVKKVVEADPDASESEGLSGFAKLEAKLSP